MSEPEDTQEYLRRAAEEREQARAEALKSEAWKSGIVGDADAPFGYVVDPNHRPDPAHMGSVDTSGTSYRSEYDLKSHTGIFDGGQTIAQRAAATGHQPVEELPVSEDLHPTIAAYERGEFAVDPGDNADIVRQDGTPTPQPMGASEYSADPKNVGTEDGSPVLPDNVVEVRGDPANADVITRGQEPEGYEAPEGDQTTEAQVGDESEQPSGELPPEGGTTEDTAAEADPNAGQAETFQAPPVEGQEPPQEPQTVPEAAPTGVETGEPVQPEQQAAEGNPDEAAAGQPQGEIRTVTEADAGGATSV